MNSYVFYDTWAFRALANRRDPFHEIAGRINLEILDSGRLPLTTSYVIDETLTGIRLDGGAAAAFVFADGLFPAVDAGEMDCIYIDRKLERDALALFRSLTGVPKLSFTECTSFAVMKARGISDAFTRDSHFDAAGFRRLVEK